MKVIQRVTSLAPVDSVCNLRNLFCTTGGSGNRGGGGRLNVHDIIVECVTTLNLTLNTLYGKTCWSVGDIAQQFLGVIIFWI